MMLKQVVVTIIPPLLTFLFFLVRQPRTKKQKLYQKAQANGWYVEAKATNKKGWAGIVFIIWGILVLNMLNI